MKEDRESRRVKVGLLYVCKVWAQVPITRFYPKAPNLEVAFPLWNESSRPDQVVEGLVRVGATVLGREFIGGGTILQASETG